MEVEEIEKFYEEWQKLEKDKSEQINKGKKKGRPVGSKNKGKGKGKKSTKEVSNPTFSTSAARATSPLAGPSTSTGQENNVTYVDDRDDIVQGELVKSQQNIVNGVHVSTEEVGANYVVEEYEVLDGMLQMVENDVISTESKKKGEMIERTLQKDDKSMSMCLFKF